MLAGEFEEDNIKVLVNAARKLLQLYPEFICWDLYMEWAHRTILRWGPLANNRLLLLDL